jgi:hypothetical protein
MFFYCYNEKDLKNGWLLEKKTSSLPPSSLALRCCWSCMSRHTVHRQSGTYCGRIESRRGGIAIEQVWTCCQPKRGYMVGRITFCCVFWHLSPCFVCYLLSCHQCCNRITLARPLTTEQMFVSLLMICWGTRWVC